MTLGNYDTSAAQSFSLITAGQTKTIKGLQYALKVTVERDGDNSAITGSTVTAGNLYGTTCAENGTTGIHYCAIPLADTGAVAKIVKSTYVTKYLNYTDRTAITDPQGTLTALLDAQDTSNASLSVDSIGTIANPAGSTGYATADGTYNNGWAWVFNITASSTEPLFQLKFSDFVNGGNSIAAANHIRYCSPQAAVYNCTDNSESSATWRSITSNNYGSTINIPYASDLDTGRIGNQVQIEVQMQVP